MADIVKTIRGLLAKARGTENEHEASMFAAKAAELLQKHNLEEAALHEKPEEDMILFEIKSIDTNPWRMDLHGALAKLYFSSYFVQQYYDDQYKLRRSIVIVGRPHNCEIVKSMAEYLITTTIRLAKEYSPDRKDRLRFEKGCGSRLAQRILQMAAEVQKPEPRLESSGGGLPALYKTELELAKSIVDNICGGNVRRGGHKGGGDAARAGARAAEGVSLGKQIQGAGSAHLLR